MKVKLLSQMLPAMLIVAGMLLVACSDGADETEAPVATPTAIVTETESPTPEAETPAPSPSPETPTPEPPTATPVPGESPEAECPIEDVVCNLGESLSVALAEGNYGAILDLMQTREETCPGSQPQGAGGPFPLCDGAAQGEMRTGYQLARRYSEGSVTDRDGVVVFLESFVNAATPDVTDGYGSGDVRLQAVSCVEPAGDSCDRATVIFTAILEGNRREVLVFWIPLPADATSPISTAWNGVIMEDEEPILFEDGGNLFDLGQVYVLHQ